MAEKKRIKSRKPAVSLRTKAIKPSAIESNVVSAKIDFKKKDVKIMDRGRGKSLLISRGVPRDEPGSPALPWKTYYMAVPWDAVPGKMTVTNVKTVKLADKIQVEPCQRKEIIIPGIPVQRVPPDKKAYSSKSVLPKDVARVGKIKRYHGFALAEIEVCPFRYTPKSGRLDMIQSMEVELNFKRTKRERKFPDSMAVYKHEEKYAEYAKKKVLNPDDVDGFKTFDDINDATDLTSYPSIDYVIITTSGLALEFQRLADWRTRLGLKTRVVTIEDILDGTVPDTGGEVFWKTSGYTDGGTRDKAEAIRNFIKWAAVHWLIDYVLLGGDTEVIPVRQAFHTRLGSIYYGYIHFADTSKPVFYEATASSEKPDCMALNVYDENVSTVWECDPTDPSPWINMSVSPHSAIAQINLTWGDTWASSYTVKVSLGGDNWEEIHSTTSGQGGTKEIKIDCVSATEVRLEIHSGTDFSLANVCIYLPYRTKYGGGAFPFSETETRVYIGRTAYVEPNPTNTLHKSMIIITDGPQAGVVIPYDMEANATRLGWRFIEDLIEPSVTVSTEATKFIQILGPAEYHGETCAFKYVDLNYIAADLYYSDIAISGYMTGSAHDWDANNNGVYGERYGGEVDGVNGLADVYLGRAPVETAEEVETFVDKVIRYEQYIDKDGLPLPSDFAVSVLLGAGNIDDRFPGLDISAAGKEDIRRMLMDHDPDRWIFTRLYEDYEDVPTTSQIPDPEEASKDAILQAIINGNNVVSFSSHGSPDSVCFLENDDISGVVSHPAIFFAYSCSTNQFDVESSEAFSEVSILNKDGGAVAFVGNTRYGTDGDNPIEYAFWEEMLNSSVLGEMYNQCKTVEIGWPSYSYNLLGDPGMRVWSDRPTQLDVVHPIKMLTGRQTFTASVTSQGQPVANAVVCTSMPGTLHATGITDNDGTVEFTIAPSVVGTMHVTVSGKNLIPYLGTVTVYQGETNCIPMLACGKSITCLPKLGCSKAVACTAKVVCGTDIVCKTDIACKAQIMCARSIKCPGSVSCGKSVACGSEIVCGVKINCGHGIGCPLISDPCPRILPKEYDKTKDLVREIWGVRDVAKFVKETHPREIEDMIKDLPKEMQKSVRMMFDRIRKEPKIQKRSPKPKSVSRPKKKK